MAKIYGVGNIVQNIAGKVELVMDIEGVQFTEVFYVLENEYCMILGMDFLKLHNSKIDFEKSTITLDGISFKLQNSTHKINFGQNH